MSPDTAEFALEETAPGRAAPYGAPTSVAPSRGPARGLSGALRPSLRAAPAWWTRLRADAARMAALRDTWRALWISRLLVWIAGAGTVATLGFGPIRGAFDPPGITRGFGWLGDLLAAPAARWDSAWYLVIAHYGYRPELGSYTSPRDAFFPLYPLGLHALSDIGLQAVLAGVLFSLAAFAVALYCLHRLTALELASSGRPGSREIASLAVLVTALAPMAFYFSAVYSESLYLALSVGLFLCARRGRWAWAGVLGMLAVTTRSTGLVLALPALMLYLYGPRADRTPDFEHERRASPPPPAGAGGSASAIHRLGLRLQALRPRYRLRANVLWLALLPAGLGLYMAYLGLSGGDTLAPFHAQGIWGRHFAGPYVGVWTACGRRSTALASCCRLSAPTSTSPRPPAARSSPPGTI